MISVGILTYTLDDLLSLTCECVQSFKDQADELIIVENGGGYQWEEESDIFISTQANRGYTWGVNTVLKNATGNYILFVSNDVTLLSGNIHDLCIPGTVTAPNIFPSYCPGFSGAMFCIPRTVLDTVGYLDENMVLRYSDTHFGDRLKYFEVPMIMVDSVKVAHTPDNTIKRTMNLSVNDQSYYESHKICAK